jgi:WhiB family transcriptional regulator, redox-sensing transcriptional regulator
MTTPDPAFHDWRQDAACRDRHPEMWWADDPNHKISRHALEICGTCAVQTKCLQVALTTPETEGIWGGLTAAQRRSLQRHRRREQEVA